MEALLIAAWVWVSGFERPTPVYFATQQACEAFREHRKTAVPRRGPEFVGHCLPTGAKEG